MDNKTQTDIWEWATNTFPHGDTQGHLNHLLTEVQELKEDPKDILEYADCMIILLHVARTNGITVDMLADAVKIKLGINRKRKWTPPDENGAQRHVK